MPDYKSDAGLLSHLQKQDGSIDQYKGEAGASGADMYDVQIRRLNQEGWQTVKSGTGKSVSFTVAPTTPGQAEKIEVRVLLKRKNENYGQPSAPAYVTVSP